MMFPFAWIQSANAAGIIAQALPILAIGAIFYFLVIAPANKQRGKTQTMLDALKKGDRVITTGGIHGTIQGVEGEIVQLKIAENVKIKLLRSAVASLSGGDSAE
ncbi:MAG TPA: preprotein translocase subunit YajC [Thermoanaerobaculia bacterium]|nr:preprotein translocase subunit YajC [Thermoanaerobaculia bacterium]